MIEDVEEFRTERQAVLFGECELLAEIQVPVLLKRSGMTFLPKSPKRLPPEGPTVKD